MEAGKDIRTIKYALLESEYYTMVNIKTLINKHRPNYRLVFIGESSKHAQSAIDNENIDLIITDTQLSDSPVAELSALHNTTTPIVFFSDDKSCYDGVKDCSIVDFVLKPVSESDVLRFISTFEKSIIN